MLDLAIFFHNSACSADGAAALVSSTLAVTTLEAIHVIGFPIELFFLEIR